ncbi:MAG: protoheme IX farnesyltransferase, partial [Rhodothermales bacterium]|nr:protoheme IX farnesyltransferase [Rhodothermales bacterium]
VATSLGYLFVYTPLKRRTKFNTLVGAVPGALPALGGWAAATGTLSAGGWALFAILFLWQLPHFLSLAWMYREDYARAGFQMLPVVEPDGRSTALHALGASLVLLIAGVLPFALGVAGLLYLVGMLALGVWFTLPAFAFFAEPTHHRARRLLLASIAYVPAFFGLVVLDVLL